MRGDDERHYPPGVVPGAVGALGALAAAVLVVGVVFGLLLANCSRPEPVQMIPTPMPAASSAAIATSSAHVVATQSVRVTVKRRSPGAQVTTPKPIQDAIQGRSPGAQVTTPDDQGEEITIEVSQGIAAAATSSAQASASVSDDTIVRGKLAPAPSTVPDHGRLGVIAATMPGILAADLQLARFDAGPLTRPLVGVDMEVGLDVAGNLEAVAIGATVGSKGFVGAYAWSRWNLSAQGLAAAVGLRF